MRNPKIIAGSVVVVIIAALGYAAIAADLSADTNTAAVDAAQYADFMADEVLDLENLADFVEGQRQYFNRITPPGVSWVQPMFPSVAPFDAAYFEDSFLDGLLGQDKYSVAVYPLSFSLDPKTRETLIYNADGKLIFTLPASKDSWATTKGETDPARVTLQLDLLPVEDVEPYLYVEERISGTESSVATKSTKGSKVTMKSLGVTEFGIANIQTQTNGAMRITATNGSGTAEVYAFTVWHTNTLEVVPDTNGIPVTNIIWWTASAPYNGVDEPWVCRTTNLIFTNGIAVWDDTDIPTNARQRMYSVALRTDSDEDGLTDGAEFFVYHSNPGTNDTDGDAMLDGWEVLYGLDPLADDSLDDPDQDGLPNVYEQFNDANPTNSDAASVAFLRVDPSASGSNVYANLKAAFDASAAYSIIEVADGIYSGSGINTRLWFPEHPVMLCSDNVGSSRQTVFTYYGEGVAFYFDAQQDNHTIMRGITLRMSGNGSYQYGFWLGPGDYYWNQGAGSAPFFDGVTVETGESSNNIAFLCYGPAPEPIIFNNCVFRGKPGKSVPMRGIYAMDSSALQIINCSYLDFPSAPYAYGVQLHSRFLEETGLVEIANCLWDSSFTASNPTPPFVTYRQFTNSAPYFVHIADSIMPAMPTWFLPDTQTNLYITNALVAMGGHLQTNSPGIDAGGSTLTLADFEGQPRDATPDIGADEYAALGEGDTDEDGLSDSSEVDTYGTDPYRADSDGDNILDGTEVADGTDLTDPLGYRFEVLGIATNQSGNSSAVWICRRWGAGAWDTNAATIATNGNFTLDVLADNQSNTLNVGAFCDYNTNGLPDAVEPVYWKTISVTGSLMRTSFLLKDYDGDYIDDWQEVLCGTDPLSASNYCVSVSGILTNVYLDTGNFHVGLSLTTNAASMVAFTNVATDGTFDFSHVIMTNASSILYIMHYDDVNTNGMWDTTELYGWNATNRSKGHTIYWTLDARDYDNDDMPDFWEARKSFNWTNTADCVADADSDGFYNVLECWMKTDPYSVNNSSNTAIRNAIAAVDDKLAGLSPSAALPIFSIQNHSTTNYVRNTNCWAYPYDITCNSPWNSAGGVYYTGTLISPRHVIFAAHFDYVTNGTIMRFVDRQNNVVERSIVATMRHPSFPGTNDFYYPDICVGLLNSDVPTNQISCAKVLPDTFSDYLSKGTRIPALSMNQFHKAYVFDVRDISRSYPDNSIRTITRRPVDSARQSFYTGLQGGDSGNPLLMFISGETVLLTVWSYGDGTGTSVSALKSDINDIMDDLGGGYHLQEINLSGYRSLE